MSAAPPPLALRYEGLTVRVSCTAPADLVWLDQFLAPWFEHADGAADCQVDLIADDLRYRDSLDQTSGSPGEQSHCFTLDRGDVRLPSWRVGGTRLVRDDRLRCSYLVDESPPSVRILTAPGNLHARFAAMRVVRELAMEQARARGRLLVHAACLAVGDDAFLIAGPKGAGKTSLLFGGLLGGAGRFLSNDRVVVRRASGQSVARGMPTIVSIRPDTLHTHPALRQRLERTPPGHWLALRTEPQRSVTWDAPSINFTPAQVCALLGVEALAAARVRALLFPRVDPHARSLGAVELDPSDGRRRLSESLFGAGGEGRSGAGLFASLVPGRGDASRFAETVADLAARVPCFECRVGPREDGVGRALSEVIDRCPARAGSPSDGSA